MLEGGFDRDGRFIHVPKVDLAKSMVEWEHSGFSVDGSVHLAAGSARAREALAQYVVRPTPLPHGSCSGFTTRAVTAGRFLPCRPNLRYGRRYQLVRVQGGIRDETAVMPRFARPETRGELAALVREGARIEEEIARTLESLPTTAS